MWLNFTNLIWLEVSIPACARQSAKLLCSGPTARESGTVVPWFGFGVEVAISSLSRIDLRILNL